MAFMFNQIKFKVELADPDAQNSKIQCTLNLWVKRQAVIMYVINRTACRSILAGAASLVDSVNASSSDALTSEQRDDQLAANSAADRSFIADMDLSMIYDYLITNIDSRRTTVSCKSSSIY